MCAETYEHREVVQQIPDPLVVDIKRFSWEDGPGIRSVVFFKGCPLRCSWCQNPEAQAPEVEVAFSPEKCIACGKCRKSCPHGAVTLEEPQRILRDRCTRCDICSTACPTGALRRIGTPYTATGLAEVLLRDLAYYRHSGGGVTFSGGEPTLYPDYLESLLERLKEEGVHLLLETCGHFDYEVFHRKLLPYLDTVYFDVKLADPQAHQRFTGKSNGKILRNLRRLLRERSVEVLPRIPLVPGVTATEENLTAVVDLLCEVGAERVELLPYNPMGLDMFAALGRPRPAVSNSFTKPDELLHLYEMFGRILQERSRVREDNMFC